MTRKMCYKYGVGIKRMVGSVACKDCDKIQECFQTQQVEKAKVPTVKKYPPKTETVIDTSKVVNICKYHIFQDGNEYCTKYKVICGVWGYAFECEGREE